MNEPKRCMQAVLAGFGGQGILFAGKIIANAGLLEDRELSWLPSYGPEMRGGTANCSVCISDDPIGSPLVLNPDVLVVMNQPSLDKFEHSVQRGDHSRGCGCRGPGAQEGQAGRQPARPGAGYPGIVCDRYRRLIAWARGALGVACRGCRCKPRLIVQSVAIARVYLCKPRSIS